MRGRGNRKKSSRAAHELEAFEHPKGKGDANGKNKAKKKGKQWRFAYDLYCKEIMS